jgi:preprotein translocase subunit SecG
MSQLILIIHILAALSVIVLVLLQHGKGADAGAAFGSGASNTMFGSVGSMPFLMKITTLLALVFFITSISLSYLTNHTSTTSDNLYKMPASQNPVSSSNSEQSPPT